MKPSEAVANIEYARKWLGSESDFSEEALDMATFALKKLEQERWISVTERLPEEEGCYLVSVKNDHQRKYSKTAWFNDGSWTMVRQKVLAWRPLPAPYQEDEDD